jgi:hypothetical protein
MGAAGSKAVSPVFAILRCPTKRARFWLLSILATAALVSSGAAVSKAGKSEQYTPTITGSVGGLDWQVKVFRRLEETSDRPCLRVTLEYAGKGTLCGEFAPLPLMTAAELNRGVGKRFVLGMVFDPRVVLAKVWFRGRDPRNVQLRLLPWDDARRIGLASLRYGATAFAGKSCLMRVAGFDGSGQLVKPVVKIPCG